MSFINPKAGEINCKLVYYGPPFSGKSTTLRQIYRRTTSESRGQPVSLTEEKDRTLFFDFLPLSLGTVKGYKIRLHLYTVPGQAELASSRRVILKGVDGVVFVADSQVERLEANIESMKDLERNLLEIDSDLASLPIVYQFNKRDLPQVVPAEELKRSLNGRDSLSFESVAIKGEGVMEPLQAIAKQILKELKKP
jgi:hypothetical protein